MKPKATDMVKAARDLVEANCRMAEVLRCLPPGNAYREMYHRHQLLNIAMDILETEQADADYAQWCEDEQRRDDAREGFDE